MSYGTPYDVILIFKKYAHGWDVGGGFMFGNACKN